MRDILGGNFGTHRHLPVDRPDESEPKVAKPVPVVERRVYSRDDSQRAWDRRRADLSDLPGIHTVLAEMNARAGDLQRRTAALLAAETPAFTAGHSGD